MGRILSIRRIFNSPRLKRILKIVKYFFSKMYQTSKNMHLGTQTAKQPIFWRIQVSASSQTKGLERG